MAFSKLTLTCVFFYFFHFVQCDQSKPADNHHREHITNENFVIHRDSGDRFLVNFYSDGCARCEEYMADFNRVEETLQIAEVKMFDCNSKMVMQGLSVKKVPSLLYFRYGIPTFFDGIPVAEDIIEWVVDSHEVLTTELHDDTFEHLTQASSGATTGDWMVVFCIKAHADCTILLASLEHVALRLLNKVNAAWIDINHNPELKERFNLKKSTEILYFRHGNKYDYHLPDTEFSNLLAFASGAYQHSRADPVEPPKTPFDKVTEQIAEEIKPIENNKDLPRDEPVEREQEEENLEVKVEQDAPQTPFFLIAGVCVSVVLALLFFLFFGRSGGGRQMKKGV